VANLKEKPVSLLPSGIYLNIKGLSLEPLWALDISTDITFGFQWQFYGSFYSWNISRDMEIAPKERENCHLVRKGKEPHTPILLLALPLTC
jgi:hypothetical protein